jgi:hypothetical protein
MFSIHRCFLPLSLSVSCLVSCSSPTAPEPAEFRLSAQQLQRDYARHQQMGIASLHAPQIDRVQDAQGQTAYLATGGAVLVKSSLPLITAKAPEILLTNDYAELRGRSVVKKAGLLYLGDADASKIIIDGVQLNFRGPHSVRQPVVKPETKAQTTQKPEVAPSTSPASVPAVPTSSGRSVVSRNTAPAAPSLTPPAKPVVRPAPVNPAPVNPAPKAASKPPVAPKPAPAKPAPVDRARVLQLMREPGDG